MNNIIVFTLTGCKYCIELKQMLQNESVDFIEINVDENEEIWTRVVNQTGHNVLPTVYVQLDGEEKGPVFIPDRDFKDNREIVDLLKYHYLKN